MDVMDLAESGLVPRWLLRIGVRLGVRANLRGLYQGSFEERCARRRALLAHFEESPIAIHTDDANRQHYELPTAFFQIVLGPWLKYSGCHWPDGVSTLPAAEEAMLALTCERAGIEDGMSILDLGCGWGSLSLWIAEHYPACRILSVSNSRTQITHIVGSAERRGLQSIHGHVADVGDEETLSALKDLAPKGGFDRIVSVEMFEHVKNYRRLMACLADLLRPGGKLFVHHFCHRELLYEFHTGSGDWMADHFFSGGTMPSFDLLLHYQDHLRLVDRWCVGGVHYARTLNAWLARFDRHRGKIQHVMAETYGANEAVRWTTRWWLFFAICEAIFGLRGGQEFLVAHWLFERPS